VGEEVSGIARRRREFVPVSHSGEKTMTTADIVRELALALAWSGTEPDQAVQELEICCQGRRVPAVRARQQLLTSVDSEQNEHALVAIGFLDALLDRLPA
jgi:hypothetical protein